MSWRDSIGKVRLPDQRVLIAASFRRVAFFVETAERTGGRRTVTHEFPGRNEPFVEDLGRSARAFSVEAYVLGDDYVDQRNALLAALEDTSGPGELVHPYYGTRRVVCAGVTVRESRDEGRMARLTIDFRETAGSPSFPASVVDAAAAVKASADAAAKAAGAEFEGVYDVADRPAFALESLSDVVTAASRAVDSALSPVVRTTQALAAAKRRSTNLGLDVEALIRKPADIVEDFRAAVEALTSETSLPRKILDALLDVYGFDSGVPRPRETTATRQQERVNYDALDRLIRRVVLVHAARLAPEQPYDSHDDAVGVRDQIAERLDEQAEVADDATFAALVQLRADLVRAVPGEDSDLPRLVRHTPRATVPSLVLAYDLYGTLDLEADLLARNRVANPAFVLGGRELEVRARV